jgi:hypothetical protein
MVRVDDVYGKPNKWWMGMIFRSSQTCLLTNDNVVKNRFLVSALCEALREALTLRFDKMPGKRPDDRTFI